MIDVYAVAKDNVMWIDDSGCEPLSSPFGYFLQDPFAVVDAWMDLTDFRKFTISILEIVGESVSACCVLENGMNAFVRVFTRGRPEQI